jgi:hypothetical protein
MAAMTTQDRIDCAAEWMRENKIEIGILKTDVRAMINAIDDYVVANAIAFNNTLPTAAKNGLSTSEKARAFAKVLEWRFKKGA